MSDECREAFEKWLGFAVDLNGREWKAWEAAWNNRQASSQGTGGEWQPIETAPDFAIFWVEPDLDNHNNDMSGMKAHACLQHRKWIPACWVPTLWQPAPLEPACKPTDSR